MCNEENNQNQSKNEDEDIKIDPKWVEHLVKGGKIRKPKQEQENEENNNS